MIDIDQALKMVRSLAEEKQRPDRMPVESVDLASSLHRILREDIVADEDSPPFDKAIRDGFAVQCDDVAAVPAVLRVIGESRAGKAANVDVAAGTCCEIMTGAPLPLGSDAVVMVEHSERLDASTVRLLKSVRKGEGLLRQGSEVRAGEQILSQGKRVELFDIGTLAGAGKAEVLVSRKPRVSIVATGDELVEVREQPLSGQIRNSNSYTLFAQVMEAGGQPELLGIARDDRSDLRDKIGRGLDSDILLVSGGVSMGKYDFVEEILAEFGVVVMFDKVAMKPGKPTVFGHRGDTFVFGLPGNPVSTLVAFHMFVRPLIQSLLGASNSEPRILKAQLEVPAKRDPARTAIVPALVRFDGTYRIKTAPWKGSSDMVGLSRSNALIVIPRGDGAMQPGEWADFISLE